MMYRPQYLENQNQHTRSIGLTMGICQCNTQELFYGVDTSESRIMK